MGDAKVQSLKKEWNVCLSKSGGNPGRCEKIEKDLRALSKASGTSSCVDETLRLMRCTTGSSRTTGCSEAFLAMRECNRAGGAQIVSEGGGIAIAPSALSLFTSGASGLVTSTPPARTLKGMQEFGQEYASSLGIAPGTVAF
mmetsp:Transcript_158266/g.295157  ORF Transcript_158266/g.295157 Transcript_158266/m.295157 type:complete len:142 (-) Transcript_158266:143-568(-)